MLQGVLTSVALVSEVALVGPISTIDKDVKAKAILVQEAQARLITWAVEVVGKGISTPILVVQWVLAAVGGDMEAMAIQPQSVGIILPPVRVEVHME